MSLAYIGLGSNVGDRLVQLRAALRLLRSVEDLEVLACSSVYETEAMDEAVGQRDFYNAAVRARTTLDAGRLLAECKRIERELGRESGGRRHGPRPIDIDLLLLGDAELAEPGLVLPHPGVARRRFVLVPLLELEPALELPGGRSLAQELAALGEGQRVSRVGTLDPDGAR